MKTLLLDVHDGARSATLVFSRFPVLVGRDPASDCHLAFPAVSRHHARIDLRGTRLVLCDEGSSLGTWVVNQSRRLPVGVFVDLQSIANEFWIGSLRVCAELRDVVPVEDPLPRPEPARIDTVALRAMQELSSTYVPYGPPLNSIEAVTEFVTRLDAVMDVLLEGVAALRYGYRCERGAPPARGPNRADLAATLLDWTHDNGALEHLREDFTRMLTHHGHVVGEASFGLQRILARLSPENIENDPRCASKWGPWRYKAYWEELKRRAAKIGRLREHGIGPTFGQAAKALQVRQEILRSEIPNLA